MLTKLSKKDLTWPLEKNSTMAIIERLGRHKNTCILALTSKYTSQLFAILDVRSTQETLHEIKASQDIVLDTLKAIATEESERAIAWLSRVNPADKRAAYCSEYQRGTGLWIFDKPEYKTWITSTSSALFIHGIPGAGKTALATLVVETMLREKP